MAGRVPPQFRAMQFTKGGGRKGSSSTAKPGPSKAAAKKGGRTRPSRRKAK